MSSARTYLNSLFHLVVRGLTVLGVVAGLVAISPASPAQAVERPVPMIHTIDYLLVSTTPNTDYLSRADLQARTDKTSAAWNRMSRGAIQQAQLGSVSVLPNFSSGQDFCNIVHDLPASVMAAMSHPLSYYANNNDGHHLVIVIPYSQTNCVPLAWTLSDGTNLSSSGILALRSQPSVDSDAQSIAHELGRGLRGLGHVHE